ncbi:hypothetical protein [Vibrio salinus]|uniref:hypothetical protein n=1 Tax=Vibrio salinus TaxID=2899784 RepID=UPI001E54C3B4|nr:hypothetical protein [Vibrio salinus]MCE0495032.1 hypothetical protein [Vibrio salinus]
MFSFFRRRVVSQLQGYYRYPFIFMTACKWVAPMSQAKFELFQQSLDNLFNWLENKDVPKGHFISDQQISSGLLQTLKRGLGYQLTPVVIANSLDLLIDIYPTVTVESARTGIVHIGWYNQFNIQEQNQHLDVFTSLEKCYPGLDVLNVGTSQQEWQSKEALVFNETVSDFISKHEQIMVSFDLSSMMQNSEINNYSQIDSDIKRLLGLCVKFEKLRVILLVAGSDRALYSRKTKVIYEGLKELAGQQLMHA